MKSSEISIKIELDDKNIPEGISWKASDSSDKYEGTKSISLSLWDQKQKNTMRIDLWTKDMPVEEMKRFHIDSIGGIAQTILNSTGDEYMANEINSLCQKLVDHLKDELENNSK